MRQNALLSRCSHFFNLAGPVCLATILTAAVLAPAAQAQTTYRWVDKEGHVHYGDKAPMPAEVKDLQLKKLKGGNVIETSGPDYATMQAAQKFPLTLYTSDNCLENCRMARDFLNQRGAPFSEKVIKTAEDADEYKKATGATDLIVPLLMAGKQLEKGYEEGAWHRLLDAAGYPAKGNAGKAGKDAKPKPDAPTP